MNVYSIVPSQRSHATVSMRNSKRIPRYAQTTAPMSSVVIVALTSSDAARRLDALRDEDDRQRVRDGPDEPGDVPPDVALGEVGVALDDAAGADELGAHRSRSWLSCHHLPVVVLVLLGLELAAGRREERLLERAAP